MTYVVSDKCVLCKYTDCVEVCPVDCFREGINNLVIDPDDCIDCALCEPECPIDAIFSEEDIDDKKMIDLNLKLSKKWPLISKKKTPLPNADSWKLIKNKIKYIKTQ